jgi:hypothetical protein
MARGGKRHQVSTADATAYLTKARGWLDAASESLTAERWDVAAGCAVMAGINACDVVCGFLLGERSGASDHTEAVGLLSTAGNDGQTASRQLAQLLRFKTPAQYDPMPIASDDSRKAVELATRLVERAATVASLNRAD